MDALPAEPVDLSGLEHVLGVDRVARRGGGTMRRARGRIAHHVRSRRHQSRLPGRDPVLVTIHEFGHFWVARKLGIKVLRFSIGFGRPLLTWRRRNGDTEYVIAALPLGGYVKMLDEREEDGRPRRTPSCLQQPGPLETQRRGRCRTDGQFLFAIPAYWGILMVGESGLRPEVGTWPDSIAAEAAVPAWRPRASVDGPRDAALGQFLVRAAVGVA
jgi:hypothetical protein